MVTLTKKYDAHIRRVQVISDYEYGRLDLIENQKERDEKSIQLTKTLKDRFIIKRWDLEDTWEEISKLHYLTLGPIEQKLKSSPDQISRLSEETRAAQIETERKNADGLMNRLMEDPEFKEFMMKKIYDMGLERNLTQ